MKRRYVSSHQQEQGLILIALKDRALDLSGLLGHILGPWTAAKKKHGAGALRCDCQICGASVIVSPKLPYQQNKGDPYHPGMKGEALFDPCLPLETVKEVS